MRPCGFSNRFAERVTGKKASRRVALVSTEYKKESCCHIGRRLRRPADQVQKLHGECCAYCKRTLKSQPQRWWRAAHSQKDHESRTKLRNLTRSTANPRGDRTSEVAAMNESKNMNRRRLLRRQILLVLYRQHRNQKRTIDKIIIPPCWNSSM